MSAGLVTGSAPVKSPKRVKVSVPTIRIDLLTNSSFTDWSRLSQVIVTFLPNVTSPFLFHLIFLLAK